MKKNLIGLLTLLFVLLLGCTSAEQTMTEQDINTYVQSLVQERTSARIETERKERLTMPERHMNKDVYMMSEYIREPFQIHLKVSGVDGLDRSDAEIYSFTDVAYERLTIDPKTWQKTDPLTDFVEHDDYVKFKDIHAVLLAHEKTLRARNEAGTVTITADLSKEDALTSAQELVFIAYPSLLVELKSLKTFTLEALFDEVTKKPLSYRYTLEAAVVVDGEAGTVHLNTSAKISALDEIQEIVVPADVLERIN